MTVHELIVRLRKQPQNSGVVFWYDGAACQGVENIWLARSGMVVLSDLEQSFYNTEDRPKGSHTARTEPCWFLGKRKKKLHTSEKPLVGHEVFADLPQDVVNETIEGYLKRMGIEIPVKIPRKKAGGK
jgi:hypothetical protein